MKLRDVVRMVLTVVLLIVVWRNAHWSVAISLTLLCVNSEVTSAVLKRFVLP